MSVDETGPSADVVAVVGSPRRYGNTATLVAATLEELTRRGLRCETLFLGDYSVGCCLGHDDCGDRPTCPLNDDAALVVGKAYSARALLLATPVYSDNVSGQMKVFMDRCCHNYTHGVRLSASVIGLVCVAESTGLEATIDCLRRFVAVQSPRALPECILTGFASKLGDAAREPRLLEGAIELARGIAEVASACS
jgi:multimeric flavodoxin WrbA